MHVGLFSNGKLLVPMEDLICVGVYFKNHSAFHLLSINKRQNDLHCLVEANSAVNFMWLCKL